MPWLWLALALLVSPAYADVTIVNYNGLGTNTGNRVGTRDISGNALDAHSGHILTVGSTYYLIGESHGCGFRGGTTGTACGLKSYSSPDLVNWTDRGLTIDASVSPWNTVCATGASSQGCYRPHMVFNAANSNYVLWIETPGLTTNNLVVALCTTPLGPCTRTTDPSNISPASGGDFALFVDTGGAGYLTYHDASNHIRVIALNSAYTDGSGSSTDTGGLGEASQMFSDGTNYYVLWSNVAAYPGPPSSITADTFYRVASTPLGTYGSTTTINSCGTQLSSADVVTAGGHTNYILRWDSWVGTNNEGLANYAWQPITPSAGTIGSYPCSATVTIAGVTLASPPSPWPPVDQSNYPSTNGFWQGCFVTNSAWYLQTFVPSKASLASVGMALGKNNQTSCSFPSNCPAPDGGIEADLYTVNGSNNPVTLLATIQLAVATLKWAPQFTLLNFNQMLTPGSTYGVVVKPFSNTTGCFSQSYDDASNDAGAVSSYPAGVYRKSTDSGATWSTQSVQSALFSTFPLSANAPLGRVLQ